MLAKDLENYFNLLCRRAVNVAAVSVVVRAHFLSMYSINVHTGEIKK